MQQPVVLFIPAGEPQPYIVNYRENYRAWFGDWPTVEFKVKVADIWLPYDVDNLENRDGNYCLDMIQVFQPIDEDILMIIKP